MKNFINSVNIFFDEHGNMSFSNIGFSNVCTDYGRTLINETVKKITKEVRKTNKKIDKLLVK